MARPRQPRQLSPLVIPFVAVGLTLLLAGIVLFLSLTKERIIPVPGPTITISVPPTPSAPASDEPASITTPEEVTPPEAIVPQSQPNTVPQQAPPAPQQRQVSAPAPVAPPAAPVQPPAPIIPVIPPQPEPQVTNELGKVVEGAGDFLCRTLFC